MRVLITSNSHRRYGQVGTVVLTGKAADGPVYVIALPDGDLTYVREGEFSIVKRQEADR
jgi:hypothetical protein